MRGERSRIVSGGWLEAVRAVATIASRAAGFPNHAFIVAALAAGFAVAGAVSAQQVETAAICDEDNEPPPPPIGDPLPAAYGDHTEACVITPATESDIFLFDGMAGDSVRINIIGLTGNFDPYVEVRDPIGGIVGGNGCMSPNTISSCATSFDFTLTMTGTHSATVTDQGGDNAGSYNLQLERILPAPLIERLNHDSLADVDGRVIEFVDNLAIADTISPHTDVDHFHFRGDAGAMIRFQMTGLTGNYDPVLELRDPSGGVVLDGLTDGAGCMSPNTISSCSFHVDYAVAESGTYSLVAYDVGNDNPGSYQLNLICLFGACDNDDTGDDYVRPRQLRYGESVTDDAVIPQVDADLYTFMGTMGDTVSFNVLGQTGNYDPAIEIRDPSGALVVDGMADDAGCLSPNTISSCAFDKEFLPAVTGVYSLVLYDIGNDNPGNYDLTLSCVFSPGDFECDDAPGRYDDDVPPDYWAFNFIEALADAGVTSGCAAGSYCPESPITRAQMAVFLERGINDGNYQPEACSEPPFGDVGLANFACAYIRQLSLDGITSGCAPGLYCPAGVVTRAQMAVFLLRGIHGAGYTPPAPSGVFNDVPTDFWAAAWIEQLAAEGITVGCGNGNYCPNNAVTRAQMAVFVVRAFGLAD